MESAGLLTKLLDQAQVEFTKVKPLIPTYSHLLISALFPICIGAHASLTRPSSAAKPAKRAKDDKNKEDSDEDEDEEEEGEAETSVQKMEGLDPSDAIMFPLMAGATLASLYVLMKWLNDLALLNKILGIYFSQAGTFFVCAFVRDGFSVFRSFIFPTRYSRDGTVWKANQRNRKFVAIKDNGTPVPDVQHRTSPLPGLLSSVPLPTSLNDALWRLRGVAYKKATLRAYIRAVAELKARFTILDVTSVILAITAVSYFTFVTKPWWLTNFLGISLCYGSMQLISPTTFWTGSLVLSALFFYDIYFVFFTPMMVTVAKGLDIPAKLLFPRPAPPGEDPDLVSMAMLGLGDIVVPGMVIGLALRFDLFLYYKAKGALLSTGEKNNEKNSGNAEPGKIPYVSAAGGWGERFWTSLSSPVTAIPPQHADGKLTFREAKTFPKAYFHASIVGYVIGMLVTLLAMQISSSPQPALLYLVPGVLGSLWMTAAVNGDIKEMWHFSDAVEEEEEEKDADKEKDEKKSEEKEKEKEKKESTSDRGFFAKVLSGEYAKQVQDYLFESAKPSKSAKDEEEIKKKQRQAEDDKSTSLNLISFSISLPKPKSKSAATKDKEEDKNAREKNTPSKGEGEGDEEGSDTGSAPSSSSSTPVLVAGNGGVVEEPVMKKRRTRKGA
ncbi:hypothetical protein AJ79_05949 [Helicocarpus griseus UAMH5409]|uniref:Signal peptide peptidase n=1 Tax=Helicocarpus griseus UAMH5409 TaxID=1447875 RepID=A0A2B7XJ58_9EURO|nr:hypothetical protein AJ79_05949 [Helicocarpus griseus UAMH5409]